MKSFYRIALATLCAASACCAQAQSFDGNLAYHNDILYHTVTLTETSNLFAWTDSYQGGTNFDPIVAVWRDGIRLAEVDDDATVAAGQTSYDAGIRLYDLAAGTYVFSIAAYDNFSNSDTLASGFNFDSQAPVAMADWCEPSNGCNRGTYARLNWSTAMVPEPAGWGMLSAGLLLGGAAVRWRRRRC